MDTLRYSREQLISALAAEYSFLCHDDFDPETDMSDSEYLAHLKTLTVEELVSETTTDDTITLDEFMDNHL